MPRDCIQVSELKDQSGHWLITSWDKNGRDDWRVLRKPDGTFWQVEATHVFPPSGGTFNVDAGEQITREDTISTLEAYYVSGKQQAESISFEFDSPDPMADFIEQKQEDGHLRKVDEANIGLKPSLQDDEQDWTK